MHALIESHREQLLSLAHRRGRGCAVNPGPETDRVLLAHMAECIERIREYTAGDRSRFEASRLVQDAVIRNLLRIESTPPWRHQGYRAAGTVA